MNSRLSGDAITQQFIRERLEPFWTRAISLPSELEGRKAAVLIPFFKRDGQWHIIYTRRSEAVNDHKGQVSFPGGVVEVGDDSFTATALREAYEEIGLEPAAVEILGAMGKFQSVSRFTIQPIVAYIQESQTYTLSADEVARVFSIPLSWLSDPTNFYIQEWRTPAGQIRPVFFFNEYDGEKLWGISAIITIQLLNILGLLDQPIPDYL